VVKSGIIFPWLGKSVLTDSLDSEFKSRPVHFFNPNDLNNIGNPKLAVGYNERLHILQGDKRRVAKRKSL
jgi:hypothetical protein